MRKIALICGLVAAAGAVANTGADVGEVKEACFTGGGVEACQAWERLDPENSRLYWVNVHTLNGWSVPALADLWGVDVDVIARLDPKLLSNEAVESAVRFNPYAVDFADADDFEKSDKLNPDQAWKWLRYRRAEIGICFEDEFLNDQGQCELD